MCTRTPVYIRIPVSCVFYVYTCVYMYIKNWLTMLWLVWKQCVKSMLLTNTCNLLCIPDGNRLLLVGLKTLLLHLCCTLSVRHARVCCVCVCWGGAYHKFFPDVSPEWGTGKWDVLWLSSHFAPSQWCGCHFQDSRSFHWNPMWQGCRI